jgi:hypothetical protein
MGLYETIFVRRSVRKYNDVTVSEELLEKINEHIAGLKQLEGHNATFKVVPGKKAPFALLSYCNDGTAEYVNVGYCLQEMDLFIQGLGLGSLWYGTKNATKNGKDGHCITMAFGNTDVPFRKSEAEFKRLKVSEISNADNVTARAVRLAPSAQNSQPWDLTFDDSGLLIEYHGRGLMKIMLRAKLSRIDLGIAIKCAELALQKEGKEIKGISITDDKKTFSARISY